MSDFDLVLSGTVVLPDRIIENGYVAVSDGKVESASGSPMFGDRFPQWPCSWTANESFLFAK